MNFTCCCDGFPQKSIYYNSKCNTCLGSKSPESRANTLENLKKGTKRKILLNCWLQLWSHNGFTRFLKIRSLNEFPLVSYWFQSGPASPRVGKRNIEKLLSHNGFTRFLKMRSTNGFPLVS